MTQSTNNDNQASNFLAAIFDGCEADSPCEIAVSWSDQHLAGKDGWLSAGCETTEVAAALAGQRAATADVYVGLGRRYPGTTTLHGRGRREDVADLPCLWADIDWKDIGHKTDDDRLPTPEQAREMAAGFPLELGVVVASGGGLHAYLLLNEALDPSSAEHLDLLLRWKGWWMREAKRAGFSIDAGVLADTTRVLRIPGTLRHKTAPPLPVVLEKCESAVRWSLDDVEAVIPEVSLAEVRQVIDVQTVDLTAEQRAALTGNPPMQDDTWPGAEAPNPRALELRDQWISEELELLAGVGTEFNYALFRCAAALYRWVAGTGLSAQWVQAALEAECIRRWGRPDRADRQTIASGRRAGMNSPREWPRGGRPDVEEAEVHDLATGEVVVAPAGAPVRPRDLDEAVAQRRSWKSAEHLLPGGGRLCAVYHPGAVEHGTWVRTWKAAKDGDGEDIEIRVVDYIIRRTHERTVEIGRGETESVYRCEVIDSRGHSWRTGWMSAMDSLSPVRVVASSRARVAAPSSSGADTNALRASLGVMEADSMATSYPVQQTGWGVDRSGVVDGPIYYGVTGSVTADGPTSEVACEPPASDGDASRMVIEQTGWDRIDHRVGDMTDAWLNMSAGFYEVPGALLGLAAMAPLRSQQQGSAFIVGRSDGGKTVLAAALRSLTSAVGYRSRSWPVDLTRDSTAGARIYARWSRDLALIADDLSSGDSQQDRWAADFVNEQAKASLGEGDGGARASTDSRTLRGTDSATCPLIVTMERLPAGQGVANRALHLEVHGAIASRPTLDLRIGGGVDYWRTTWGETGDARAVWAGYLTWIAQQVRDGGPAAPGATLRSLAVTSTASWDTEYGRLSDVLPTGSTRAVQLAASVSLGWLYLRTYAASVGQGDDLPSADEVDGWLASLVGGTRGTTDGMAAGPQITAWVAAALASGRGRVEACDGRAPVNALVRRAMGWPSDGSTGGSVPLLGRLSRDQQVLVLNTAVPALARRDVQSLQAMPDAELRDRLADDCVPDLRTAAGAVSRALGVGQMRGYPVLLSALGIDLGADGEAVA